MTAGILLTLLFAGVATALIVAPLVRKQPDVEVDHHAQSLSRSRELESQQQMLLAALKDLEDDRETDKIGEEDYERLHAELSGQAVQVMQELDALAEQRKQDDENAHLTLRYPGKKRSGRTR